MNGCNELKLYHTEETVLVYVMCTHLHILVFPSSYKSVSFHLHDFNGVFYYDTLFEVIWKVKIKVLNFKNIRIDNFNSAKSLRNICKGVYFFLKKELIQSYFWKYYELYLKEITFFKQHFY